MYPTYLVHFNRQHDPKTGMFTYGDGDGDGIANDHAHERKGNGISLARKGLSSSSSRSSQSISPRSQHNAATLRSINTDNMKSTSSRSSNGRVFTDSLGNNWVDGAKASDTESGHIYLSRNVGIAVIDVLDNEDEEKKIKRKQKILQDTGKTDYSRYRKPGSSRNDKAAQLGNEAWEKDTAPYRRN